MNVLAAARSLAWAAWMASAAATAQPADAAAERIDAERPARVDAGDSREGERDADADAPALEPFKPSEDVPAGQAIAMPADI